MGKPLSLNVLKLRSFTSKTIHRIVFFVSLKSGFVYTTFFDIYIRHCAKVEIYAMRDIYWVWRISRCWHSFNKATQLPDNMNYNKNTRYLNQKNNKQ